MKGWRCTDSFLCEKPQFPINLSFAAINPRLGASPALLLPQKHGDTLILESLYPGEIPCQGWTNLSSTQQNPHWFSSQSWASLDFGNGTGKALKRGVIGEFDG